MGKARQPLKIIVFGAMVDWVEVQELKNQGHEIVTNPDERDFHSSDIILGPTCHRMDELHRPYLNLAIEEAKKKRYK